MFYIDGLKVKEIATKLNINETTVKQRLFLREIQLEKRLKL